MACLKLKIQTNYFFKKEYNNDCGPLNVEILIAECYPNECECS